VKEENFSHQTRRDSCKHPPGKGRSQKKSLRIREHFHSGGSKRGRLIYRVAETSALLRKGGRGWENTISHNTGIGGRGDMRRPH